MNSLYINDITEEITGGTASVSAIRTVGENQSLSPRSSSPAWRISAGLACLLMTPLPNPAIEGILNVTTAKIVDQQSQFEQRTTLVKDTAPVIAPLVEPPHEDEKAWECLNDDRIDLITKKYDSGLSFIEQQRLVLLEDAMTRHLNVVAPISTFAIDELMKEVARLKSGA
jgi:hypothetical protein